MSSGSFTLASNCSLIGCSDLHFYLTNSCMAGNFRKLIQMQWDCTNFGTVQICFSPNVLTGMIGRPVPLTLRLTPRY